MTEMYDCPYAPGLQCNQREIMCDKGQYDAHCIMNILRQMSFNGTINMELFKEQAITDAVLYLFDHRYFRQVHNNEPPSKVITEIMNHLTEGVKTDWMTRCMTAIDDKEKLLEQHNTEDEQYREDCDTLRLIVEEVLSKPNDYSIVSELGLESEDVDRILALCVEGMGW